MDKLNSFNNISANNIFTDYFIDSKILYTYLFNKLPNMIYLGHIDGEKTFASLKQRYAQHIVHQYERKWYKRSKKVFEFDETILVLDNNCILEIGANYCEIYHNGNSSTFTSGVSELVIQFKERQRREPLEINLIVQGRYRLELKAMEIKRTKLDLDLFYEDDFKPVDGIIQKRLQKKNDKGIVLLHGLSGTGKTTYLRYLIGKIKKRVLFVSPSIAGNLMNPDFLEMLIDNPNTVVIIEDAENILMDRKHNSGSAVSNLLNISDGLLADFLNVQLICTFNSALTFVDDALLRKGRLIAKYEFGKLGIGKSQRLSEHFGFDKMIEQPMTIAEIVNQNEKTQVTKSIEILGFRRNIELVN